MKVLYKSILLTGLLLCCHLGSYADDKNFDQHAWLEDFEQLKHQMSVHYANLEWAVSDRRMDLKDLSEKTEARLLQSRNDSEARSVVESFLRAFGDGHLRVIWQSSADKLSASKQSSMSSRLGFRAEILSPGIGYQFLDTFEEVSTSDSKYFPAGILTLPGGKKFGVVRIATFNIHSFPDLCDSAVAALGVTPNNCDDACARRVEQLAADYYIAALERQVRALGDVSTLIVDITGNGGGGDVCEPMARVLTSKHLRSARIGFMRHQLWIDYLTNHLTGLDEKSKQGHPSSKQREQIVQGVDAFRKAIAEARLPVARDNMWKDEKPDRSLLVNDRLFASGTMPYLNPAEFSGAPALDEVFSFSRYAYHEGVYNGPLMVLVDDRTGSSSEEFAAMLVDNGAAKTIGSTTAGAGFGYYGVSIPTFLSNCGAEIKMPDGVRYRADGSNEVSGIEPDILIPWRQNYSPYQKAKSILNELIKLIQNNPS